MNTKETTHHNEAIVPTITTTRTTTGEDQSTVTTTTEYNNPLIIDNPYLNVLSLIDVTYPPLICSTCDRVATSDIENRYHHHMCHHNNRRRRYPCLHPHCELSFNSRTALRYHLRRSHLVKQASFKQMRPEPPFMHYRLMPPLGTFTPTVTKPATLFHLNSHQCILHPHHQQQQQQQPQQQQSSYPNNNNNITTTTTTTTINNKNATTTTRKRKPTMTRIIPVNIPTMPMTSPTKQQQPTTPTTTTTTTTSHRPSSSSSSLSFKIHTSRSYALTSTTLTSPVSSSVTKLSPAVEALINAAYHPLYCPCCQAEFPKKTNVIKHVSEMHQGQEPYTCVYEHCTAHRKHYATRDGLVYHMLRYHEDTHAMMDMDENHQPSNTSQQQQQQSKQDNHDMEIVDQSSTRSKNLPVSREVRWKYPR